MPRKKRNVKKRDDSELRLILSNPFAALAEPWEDPAFDWPGARRVWRAIREDTLEIWRQKYPGQLPPGAILFDRNV